MKKKILYFKNQLLIFCQGDVNLKKKKITTLIFYLYIYFFFFLFIIIFLFTKLLNKFLIIRFGILNSSRIGHFSIETELYLIKKKKFSYLKRKVIDIFCIEDFVCNYYLLKIINTKTIILPIFLISPIVYWMNKFRIRDKIVKLPYVVDYGNLLEKNKPIIKLGASDLLLGAKKLKEFGVQENDKIVCLIVRDSAYLNKFFPFKDWSYHNYRDCEIDNYLKACKKLSDLGYFVFRMGVVSNKSIKISDPKIIDYCNSNLRSEFLDVYIASRCTFGITSGTGYDSLINIFRKPIIYTNYVPVGTMHVNSLRFLTIIKHHFSNKLNRYLSLSEIYDLNLSASFDGKDFEKKEIKLIENTEEEITSSVIELEKKISKNNFKNTNLQNEFIDFLKQSHIKYGMQSNIWKLPSNKIYLSSMANSFLEKNRYLIK
jgi:putative glycosyltransferase (TIGR04372 family)